MWVKGHDGVEGNETADARARQEVEMGKRMHWPDIAARKLCEHKMTAFANQNSLTALRTYIHNPSVTGFFNRSLHMV